MAAAAAAPEPRHGGEIRRGRASRPRRRGRRRQRPPWAGGRAQRSVSDGRGSHLRSASLPRLRSPAHSLVHPDGSSPPDARGHRRPSRPADSPERPQPSTRPTAVRPVRVPPAPVAFIGSPVARCRMNALKPRAVLLEFLVFRAYR